MSDRPHPTEAELEILAVLWHNGCATVRAVHERIAVARGTGYTTTLKVMQMMFGKGLVKRDERGRSHIYRAAQPPAQAQRQLVGRMIDKIFAGSTSALVQQALVAGSVDAAELAEIRRMLDAHAGATRGGRSKS